MFWLLLAVWCVRSAVATTGSESWSQGGSSSSDWQGGWRDDGWRDRSQGGWRDGGWRDDGWRDRSQGGWPDPAQTGLVLQLRGDGADRGQKGGGGNRDQDRKGSGKGQHGGKGRSGPREMSPCASAASSRATEPSDVAMPVPGMTSGYSCAECMKSVYRTNFLIEQWDTLGRIAPGEDFQGRLYGRCFSCARGLGRYKWVSDVLEDIIETGTEKDMWFRFSRAAKHRHGQRQDVKTRDIQRLRNKTYDDLMAEAALANPGDSRAAHRRAVVEFLKPAVRDVMATLSSMSSELQARFKKILDTYVDMKRAEAEDPSSLVEPCGCLRVLPSCFLSAMRSRTRLATQVNHVNIVTPWCDTASPLRSLA